jgi:hypothetical protein
MEPHWGRAGEHHPLELIIENELGRSVGRGEHENEGRQYLGRDEEN